MGKTISQSLLAFIDLKKGIKNNSINLGLVEALADGLENDCGDTIKVNKMLYSKNNSSIGLSNAQEALESAYSIITSNDDALTKELVEKAKLNIYPFIQRLENLSKDGQININVLEELKAFYASKNISEYDVAFTEEDASEKIVIKNQEVPAATLSIFWSDRHQIFKILNKFKEEIDDSCIEDINSLLETINDRGEELDNNNFIFPLLNLLLRKAKTIDNVDDSYIGIREENLVLGNQIIAVDLIDSIVNNRMLEILKKMVDYEMDYYFGNWIDSSSFDNLNKVIEESINEENDSLTRRDTFLSRLKLLSNTDTIATGLAILELFYKIIYIKKK